MERIPLSFKHNGKNFTGRLSNVTGAGSGSVWYLMDDKNYYLGRLRMGWQEQWYFDESKPENKLSQLADYFGDYITAWIQ